jgi:hypothetical protein
MNGSLEHFDISTDRAGSHFAPAKLTITSIRISKIEIPSIVPGGPVEKDLWDSRYMYVQ